MLLLMYDDEATEKNIVGMMLRNGLLAKGGGDRGSALSSTGGYPQEPTFLSLEVEQTVKHSKKF